MASSNLALNSVTVSACRVMLLAAKATFGVGVGGHVSHVTKLGVISLYTKCSRGYIIHINCNRKITQKLPIVEAGHEFVLN